MKLKISVVPLLFAACSLYFTPSFAQKSMENGEEVLMLDEANADLLQNQESTQWRFIKGMGWRKFTPLGATIKDVNDWDKVHKPYWFRRW